MAEWIGYDQWLAKNKLARTAANAANWTRQYGPGGLVPKPGTAPAAPAAAPEPVYQQPAPAPYTPPAYDPNYQDAQLITERSQNNAKYDTTRLNARQSYGTWLNQTYGDGAAVKNADGTWAYDLTKRGGKFANIAYDEGENIRTSTNNLAARRALRSGIRVANEDRIGVGAARQRTEITNQQQTAFNDMQGITGQADQDQIANDYQLGMQAQQRRVDKYNRDYGMGS